MKISVVIPANNEETNIRNLHERLTQVLRKNFKDYEIIIVDDGSADKTFSILKKLHEKDRRLKAIRLARRFGQSPALTAGFDNSRGEIIIMSDADLQNDPRDIPRVVRKIQEGYDVVSGWRFDRKDPFLTKIIPSRIFNFITRRMTGIMLHDFGCTLKGYRREALKGIKLYGQTHRLIPALVKLNGYNRISELKVQHHARFSGKARYGLIFGRYNLLSRGMQYFRDVTNIRRSFGKKNPLKNFEKFYKIRKLYQVKEKIV